MRHKLRQCKICGQSFVDRAEIAETCFDCRSSESSQVAVTSAELGSSEGASSYALGLSSISMGLSSSSLGLSSSSQSVVLGTSAPQLVAAESSPPAETNVQRDPLKLFQEESNGALSPSKSGWVSPPFKVKFEDHVDLEEPVPTSAQPRLAMRARYKIILAGAILLFYFLWPVTPVETPEDGQDPIALNDPRPTGAAAPQQPDPAQEEEQQEQPADSRQK